MVRLTFYGGVNEIGGNKILLEDGEQRLLLDFGFPYKRHKLFYEEYLKPRPGAGLLDLLMMGLLPPLEGLYRDDLVTPGLWQQFRHRDYYRKLEGVDGVLLSHAHLDHSGHIALLKEDMPIYTTAITAFVAKAVQDSGKADFDQQVCYFDHKEPGRPSGWKQEALLTIRDKKQQRQFCLADVELKALSDDAVKFWLKSPGQKPLISCSLASHSGCSLNLRCFPVDHSIPGACAWGIETSSGWVMYTGDLRLHGKRADLTKKFIQDAGSLHPRALVLEGTNVTREMNVAEHEVYENGLKATKGATGLVIADFPPRDVNRLLTFLQIARDTDRKLAILPRDAYLLQTMRLLEPDIPDIAQEESILIYQDTVASPPKLWLQNLCKDYGSKMILAEDVRSAEGKFILCFSFFDINELPSIRPGRDGLYVFSSSEPHDEEQEIDFRRLHKWLEHFEIRGFGLPVEKNGEWEIPEEERGLHASGHACGPDLLEVARGIKPEVLIPVHSEHPDFYTESLGGSGIDVVLPTVGGSLEV